MVGQSASIVGLASGTSVESEDTLRFSAMSVVRPVIETLPLASTRGLRQNYAGRGPSFGWC
jgi:hypothetical protein